MNWDSTNADPVGDILTMIAQGRAEMMRTESTLILPDWLFEKCGERAHEVAKEVMVRYGFTGYATPGGIVGPKE